MIDLSSPGIIRELLDGLSDQVYAIDARNGRVLDCNEGACRALGYSRDELLALSVPDFDHNVDLESYLELIARIRQADREVTIDSTHTRRDGTSFPVEITARLKEAGEELLSICVVRDLTSRHRLEHDLREQTRQYQTIVRNLPGLIYRYRLGNPSTVLYVDERVKDLLGYTAEEFLSGAISLREAIVPEDRKRVGEALRHAVASGEIADVTYGVVCKDGSRKVLRDVLQASPPDETGMPLIEAISFDVSESAERERALEEAFVWEHKRFEDVALAAGIVIYERDMSSGAIAWSGPYEELLGYGPGEIGGAAEWETRVSREDRQRVVQASREAYAAGNLVDVEFRFRRKDGQERWLWLRGIPRYDDDGRLARSIGMLQDITKRKELEAQVSSAQRMDTVGALAGGIAHDVNNYLTTIMGNLDLSIMRLREGEWPELRDARSAAAGCAELVRSLLTFARQKTPERTVLSAADVVDDAVRILRRLGGTKLVVESAVDDGCPDFEGDRVQVQQVLMNLAINARDAMNGEGRITIGAEASRRGAGDAPHGGFVRLWVRDTGPGIAPEIRDRIFEPYFTTRPFGEGTGLGLAIVHGIARAHGGWAEVTDADGGAEFSVFLPARG